MKAGLPSAAARELERRVKTAVALAATRVLRRTAARVRGSRPWLIGGAVGAFYGDNSAALHQHIREHHPEINVYWVINRDSRDVERAAALGPVLYRDEMKTYFYALLAEVHVISHGVHDVPTCASSLSKALKVRLGHGLTALKKTKPRALHSNESANAVFGLVPVSSEFEKANKATWGIPEDALVITGVPRFDTLLRKARTVAKGPGPRRVLYMPTWREWLPKSRDALLESELFQNVRALLTDDALAGVLEEHDAVLEVAAHPILREQLDLLAPTTVQLGRVRWATGGDIQDLLVRCDVLVTDYSSVAWDVLYLGRPVLFFAFDVDEYERHRGAYFDLRNDLPGPSASDVPGMVALIERALNGEIERDESIRARRERWMERVFPYRDDRNCERVMREILRKLGRRPWGDEGRAERFVDEKRVAAR